MGKTLERDLGLFSVLAISIGAMIGSGIFILPALAAEIAGPAVVLAYVIAGLLVVPAALSKAEMATAMPESGGTYLFIERGLGPLLGTVAGAGTWFALSFKGALALVGGVPYLLYLFEVPQSITTPLALALAVILVVVNVLGAKQTGRLQVVIVGIMLLALGWFAIGGVSSVQLSNYNGFLSRGPAGLLEATGLVFVSYAGVTKVASVAEEIENPGRNIPIGILGSLAFTTALYVLIVFVMLGVTDPAALSATDAPMAIVADAALGSVGVIAVVIAALLALVSTANAGVLSSSRYPFAMSRDGLVPDSLGQISDRFGTPSTSITLTGVVLLLLIAFVPITEIAKLASAFQILVFVLINIAIVAFRRGVVEYEPTFHAPFYPWVQVVGVVGGLVLLTQMGTVPLVGAVLISVAGVVWYLTYARPRIDREGVAVDAVRRELGRQTVEQTREAIAPTGSDYEVLVAIREGMDSSHEEPLIQAAIDLAAPQNGAVTIVRFDEVADQVPLEAATDQSSADLAFEKRLNSFIADRDVPVQITEVVSHDARHAIANQVKKSDADALVLDHRSAGLRRQALDGDVEWVLSHTGCDVLIIKSDGAACDDIETVRLLTPEGVYDPATVAIADAIATAHGASISLEYAVDDDASKEEQHTLADYREEIAALCSVPVRTREVRSDGGETVDAASATITSIDSQSLAVGADPPVFVVRPRQRETPRRLWGRLGRWLP